ncbi:uncharacterized protein V6R79_001497 [Siganus canaliculatus]
MESYTRQRHLQHGEESGVNVVVDRQQQVRASTLNLNLINLNLNLINLNLINLNLINLNLINLNLSLINPNLINLNLNLINTRDPERRVKPEVGRVDARV